MEQLMKWNKPVLSNIVTSGSFWCLVFTEQLQVNSPIQVWNLSLHVYIVCAWVSIQALNSAPKLGSNIALYGNCGTKWYFDLPPSFTNMIQVPALHHSHTHTHMHARTHAHTHTHTHTHRDREREDTASHPYSHKKVYCLNISNEQPLLEINRCIHDIVPVLCGHQLHRCTYIHQQHIQCSDIMSASVKEV